MVNGKSSSGMREFTMHRWSLDDFIKLQKGLWDLYHDVGGGELNG